jgi:hypothetical protein
MREIGNLVMLKSDHEMEIGCEVDYSPLSVMAAVRIYAITKEAWLVLSSNTMDRHTYGSLTDERSSQAQKDGRYLIFGLVGYTGCGWYKCNDGVQHCRDVTYALSATTRAMEVIGNIVKYPVLCGLRQFTHH